MLIFLPFLFLSFKECDENEGNKKALTTAQRKAQLIMESFENPFKMVKSPSGGTQITQCREDALSQFSRH